jgi:rhodanese-related sulfurtransferase
MTASPVPIDPATLQSWLQDGTCIAIDVREPGEFAREHVRGSHSMPLSTFDPAALPPGNKKIALLCASGARAKQAAQRLSAAGIGTVCLEGGLAAWRQAGFAVTLDLKAPLPLMRQVQIVAGSLVVLGVVLGASVDPAFFALAGFVGAGLVFAGVSGWCGMAMLLAKLPYNRV